MFINQKNLSIKNHSLIFVPGLGNDVKKIQLITRFWQKFGFKIIIHPFGWHDDNQDFNLKLKKLIQIIDAEKQNGNSVSLIGMSAGASAVLNAFLERREIIDHVVSVCGRLKTGTQIGFRSFESRTKSSHVFAESVKNIELREGEFNVEDRAKILTISAGFGDELVPADTSTIDGARNVKIPMIEHMLSIGSALTIFSRQIINFLII